MESGDEAAALLRRIEQLERRWQLAKRWALVAAAAGCLLLVGWAPIQNDDDVLEVGPAVDRLVIGKEGGYSILLEGQRDAARLVIRDREKRARNLIELTDAGFIHRIVDRNGRGRFDLLVTDRQIGGLGDNEARLKISDADGKDAVLIVSTSTNQGLVVVNTQGENKTMLTEKRSEGQPVPSVNVED